MKFRISVASLFLTISIFIIPSCDSTQKKPVKKVVKPVEVIAPRDEPNPDPMLRINASMHNGVPYRLSTDRDGRYIVTGAVDKTVKVFDSSSGKLLSTLRPPIDVGKEGRIDAVAISPDAEVIACSGWTGWDWEKSVSIYLFYRTSGKMFKRIQGLPDVVAHLAFSPDGKYLAAAIYGSNGVRVYKSNDWSLVMKDTQYSNDASVCVFDNSGRLVAVSDDGFIRLYGSDLILQKKIYAKTTHPFGVSITADGKYIAVSSGNQPEVDIYSGKDLSFIVSPDLKGFSWGVYSVAWTADGKSLYAGGATTLAGKEIRYIIRWKNDGFSKPELIPAGIDSVVCIIPFKKDMVAYVTADPEVGIIRGTSKLMTIKSATPVHRYTNNRIKISRNGSIVGFGYEFNIRNTAFNFRNMMLEDLSLEAEQMSVPVVVYPGVAVSNWNHNYAPSLNGQKLSLDRGESSRCMSINPSTGSFALGADWYLRYFNAAGTLLWQVPETSVCWDVNISADGRFVIAAFGDGIIKWYRASDGRELLNLFPHNDRKQWVVWTQRGFYASSAGSDDMIGWHVNQGKEKEALFFPAFAFSQYMNKPEVIQKIIEFCKTDDELMRELNLPYPDIKTLMPELLAMIGDSAKKEKLPEGEIVGKVFSINSRSGEIVVATGSSSNSIRIGDGLFVIVNKKRIQFRVTFPMMTVVRCKIKNMDDIKLVTSGDRVFK
jgi:WD40 repeat protein